MRYERHMVVNSISPQMTQIHKNALIHRHFVQSSQELGKITREKSADQLNGA